MRRSVCSSRPPFVLLSATALSRRGGFYAAMCGPSSRSTAFPATVRAKQKGGLRLDVKGCSFQRWRGTWEPHRIDGNSKGRVSLIAFTSGADKEICMLPRKASAFPRTLSCRHLKQVDRC